MTTQQEGKIQGVLGAATHAVIATVGESVPESALITIIKIEGQTIVFRSHESFRKNANMHAHPEVSCVVGWDPVLKRTLQMEGLAEVISDYEGAEPEWEYFKIVPKWIRYSDFAASPKEVWEVQV